MIIDKNSLFFHFVSSVGSHHMPTDICGLTRRFLLAIIFWTFFGSIAIILVGSFLYITAQIGAEIVAAFLTGFYDQGIFIAIGFYLFVLSLWTSIIGGYLYERYNVNIFSPIGKVMEKIKKSKEEKQDSVYVAMIKSFFGKFCIRVEYKG